MSEAGWREQRCRLSGVNWAWMTGVEGNGDVKSDYRDSYPEQRREGWDV